MLIKPAKVSPIFGLLAAFGAQAITSGVSFAADAPASAATPAPTATVNGNAIGADLNLSPKRVVFDGSTHSTTVFVFNQGVTSGTYSVELVDEIMLPDGRIETVSDAASDPTAASILAKLKSAKDLMMVTPHRISLSPHDSQTVRIRVHPPSDDVPAEYRTHLVIKALPPEDSGLTAEQASATTDNNALSVKIIALYSLAIPLFYRQGPPDSRGHMEHLTLSPEGDHSLLQMDMVRDGTTSVYGAVEVHAGGPKGELVGLVDGVGVYPEVDHHQMKLSLRRKIAPGEHLTVTWRDQDVKQGALLATSELTAP